MFLLLTGYVGLDASPVEQLFYKLWFDTAIAVDYRYRLPVNWS